MDQTKNDVDPIKISAIKEELRDKLTSIASKLLSSEHTRLEHLSNEEQILWNSFDNGEIYEFITGEPDTLPEFQITGLNLVNLRFTSLKRYIAFQTSAFNFLQIQTKRQFKSLHLQSLHRSLHNFLLHKFFTKIRGYLRLISPKSINQSNNQWLDQAD
jgi:hypothetical protein